MDMNSEFRSLFFWAVANWRVDDSGRYYHVWFKEDGDKGRNISVSAGVIGMNVRFYDERINKIHEMTLWTPSLIQYKRILKQRKEERANKKKIDYLR